MNIRKAIMRKVAGPICLAVLAIGSVVQSNAASDEIDYAKKLSQAHLFLQPLIWVGTNAPDPNETRELYQDAGLDPDSLPADRLSSMESFAKGHPNSPWTPSLFANLARYYRSQGRYGAALDSWQEAWNHTQNLTDPNGRKVADYTVAYWSELLASLGRTGKLQELIASMDGRQLSAPEFQRQFDEARQAAVIMTGQPGASFRCGSVALFHVARALDPKSDFSSLEKMESPSSGFSLAQLVELSDQLKLGLTAVKRPSGGKLVVPSVIHWKEDHYAAIVEERSGGYRVIDPTFGRPQWLSAATINENASGYFLIPTNHVPVGWQSVAIDDAKKIFGKGLHNFDGTKSGPKCDAAGNPCDTCPYDCPKGGGDGGNGPGRNGSGDGGDGGGGCSSQNGKSVCGGMPDWEVQEPYISLWLHDRPMFYNMSFGRQFLFQVDYHQREEEGDRYNFTFGDLGPNWNCNLLTYILVSGTVTNAQVFTTNCSFDTYSNLVCSADEAPLFASELVATEYCPDGGQRTYEWDGTNRTFLTDPRTHVQFFPAVTNVLFTNSTIGTAIIGSTEHYLSNSLVYPNGSVAIFDKVITISTYPDVKIALITSAKDPQGHVMKYSYTNSGGETLLSQVVDFDGKTNNFIYGNGSFPTSITQVTNTAYSLAVNFKYDGNGNLTNIVDVAGISSSFQYTFTNEPYYTNYDLSGHPVVLFTKSAWLLTKLSTPYGDTRFDYFHATWPIFGTTVDANINRAITVTQPDSGKHLFLYSDESSHVSIYFPNTPSSGTPNTDFNNNYNAYLAGTDQEEPINNSFHWGPRQYALLSSTVLTNLIYNDFATARLRNWLHADLEVILGVSQTLNGEDEPSPDSGLTPGHVIRYSYEGKSSSGASYVDSTNDDLPVGIGQVIDSSGADYYDYMTRNSNGFPTKVVSFGTLADRTTLGIKTNSYIYAANNVDLLQHIGPDRIAQETYTYDGNHNVTSMSNALCEVTLYSYNGMGQVTGITQPNGLVTTNIYGADGFLATTYDYSGTTGYRTNTYTYTNGLVLTHTDERGLTTTNSWDALQRLTKIAYPDGTSVTYTYSNLDLVRVIDRLGFTNSYVYDNMRRKIAETNALGYATLYSYCTCGALDYIQDALGNQTHFYYDRAGRLTNTTYADLSTVTRTYNEANQVINITSSSGKSTAYQYDGLMRKALIFDAADLGNPVLATYAYDVNDLVTNQVDANGVSLNMTYDALHRLRTRTYPDTGVEGFGYTLNVSGMTSYTNQLKNVWTYAYDILKRKTNEIATGVYTNSFAYDPAGDLLTLLDGRSQATSWKYDLFGRVTNKLDNLGTNLFIYAYDADNRLTSRTSAAKGTTAYSYDNGGNLTFIDYPVSPDITLKYDALNRLTNMVDTVGTTRYSYDAVGQVLSEDGPWDDDTVSYTYANRLRTSLSVAAPNASAWTQSYGYDLLDRLTNVTSTAGSFGYDFGFDPSVGYVTSAGSLIRKLNLPNGAYITNRYDNIGRMTGTYLRNSSDVNLDTEDYVYNVGNQRTQQVFTAGNFVNYSYDTIGELRTANGKESGGVTNRMQEQFGYVYDAAGNLNYRTNNTLLSQFDVNSLNELTTVTNGGKLTAAGATTSRATTLTVNSTAAILYGDTSFASTNQSWVNGNNTYTAVANDSYGRQDTDVKTVNLQQTNTFAYDLNGNMVTNGTRVLEYDDENQLIRVSEPNAWKSEFTYDGKMRRRIRKEFTWNGSWLQTNEVHYVYDGILVIQERDSHNLAQLTYTRSHDLSGTFQGVGGIGGLLARTDMAMWIIGSSLAHAFYHADGSGNVISLTFPDQSIAAKYKYDTFGNTLSKMGPLAEANNYQFSSKEYHPQSGLIYYLYRYYQPHLQRWVNRDPIGERGGVNSFQFAGNSVPNAGDSFGLYNFWQPPSNINAPPSQASPAPPPPYNGPGLYPWPTYLDPVTAAFGPHPTQPSQCPCSASEAAKCVGALAAATAQAYAATKACNAESASFDPINCNIQAAKAAALGGTAGGLCSKCMVLYYIPPVNYNPYGIIPM